MTDHVDALTDDIRNLGITVLDDQPVDLSAPLAQHLHDLGYRKPRTITTIEELDNLGRGAAIVEPGGAVWVNDGQSEDPWASFGEDPFGGPIWTDSSRITLPVTVVREAPRD
jgi:hypothetical protein